MKYLDIHAHVFPETIAEKAVAYLEDYYHFHWEGNGLATDLLAGMDLAGVRRTVIFSSATKPEQVPAVNNYIAGLCRLQPERFTGFGTLHRDFAGYREELCRMREMGLTGLKFHPDFQGFDIDDPEMMKIYEAAGPEMVMLFHLGDPVSDRSAPERLAKVLDVLPELRVIAAHFGGYCQWERAKKCLVGRNVWLDTSSAIPFLGAPAAKELILRHGVERVLWGSDYPAVLPQTAIAQLESLGLPEEDLEKIFYRNAEALLGVTA